MTRPSSAGTTRKRSQRTSWKLPGIPSARRWPSGRSAGDAVQHSLTQGNTSDDGLEILSANCGGWKQLDEVWHKVYHTVVCVQEHKTADPFKLDEKVEAMRKAGWVLALHPATQADQNATGGVLIATRGGIGVRYIDICWVQAPQPHRLVAAEIREQGREPFLLCSAYLKVKDGMSQLNVGIIASAMATACKNALPMVLAADFNNTPTAVDRSGVLDTGGCWIMAPSGPTCITSKSSRCIDYFIASPAARLQIQHVAIYEGVTCNPHRPVVCKLKPTRDKQMRQVLCRPAKLPVHRLIGPLPEAPWEA